MQKVTLENGEVHQFPDDATPDEINSALSSSDKFTMSNKNNYFSPLQQSLLQGDYKNFANQELSNAANSPLVNAILGAGDAINNVGISAVNSILNKNIPKIHNSSGFAYGAGEYLPYAASGIEGLIGKGIGAIPKLSEEASPILNWAGRNIGTGALFGQQQYNDPISGIEGQLAGSAIGHGIGSALNTIKNAYQNGVSSIFDPMRNAVLSYLNKRSQTPGDFTKTPEQTASNLENYTTLSGEQMPVDIGTLTGNPRLSAAYSATSGIPFSGTSNKQNLVQQMQKQKEIDQTSQSLQDENKKFNDEKQRIDQQRISLQDSLNNIKNNKNSISINNNQANNLINNLQKLLLNRTNNPVDENNISEGQASDVKSLFKYNMKQSEKNYDPIKNSGIEITGDNKENFPSYFSQISDLAKDENHFNQIFGGSDLGSTIKKETEKGEAFLKSPSNNNVSLSDILARSQAIGKLAANKTGSGDYNGARILNNLRYSLNDDISNFLTNRGRSDLADQMNYATQWHKENVVPFYNDNTLYKVAKENYIPINDELAKSVYNPNFSKILNSLPDETKQSLLGDLITKGKTTGSISNLTPSKIADRYSNLDRSTRYSVSQVAPDVHDYLNNLGKNIQNEKMLNEQQKIMKKQIDSMKEPDNSNISYLVDELNKKQNELSQLSPNNKTTIPNINQLIGGGGAAYLAHLLPHAMISAPIAATLPLLLGRTLSKELTNTQLIRNYIEGNRYKIPENKISKPFSRLLPYLTTPGMQNNSK